MLASDSGPQADGRTTVNNRETDIDFLFSYERHLLVPLNEGDNLYDLTSSM